MSSLLKVINIYQNSVVKPLCSVSKLSIESVGSRRELVANCVHTADADATKQFCCVGGVYWALGCNSLAILVTFVFCSNSSTSAASTSLASGASANHLQVGYDHLQVPSQSGAVLLDSHPRNPFHSFNVKYIFRDKYFLICTTKQCLTVTGNYSQHSANQSKQNQLQTSLLPLPKISKQA